MPNSPFDLGFGLDLSTGGLVTNEIYQMSSPSSDNPMMTRSAVMSGDESACTLRSASGVKMGASHSRAIILCGEKVQVCVKWMEVLRLVCLAEWKLMEGLSDGV
jgi:hypothetical protein